MVAKAPENARHDDLALRLRADLGAPPPIVGILDVVTGAETDVVTRFEFVDRIRSRRVLLATDAPEEITRLVTWIDPEILDLFRRGRTLRRTTCNSAPAGDDQQQGDERHS